MARIRTIKPEFFKHEDLFDAEKETGLPLRLAFAGLWTVCDREGRFEWRPRAIKTDVLPYDDVDFSRVLDALATRGFVVRYRVDGKDYGFVPGFSRHQVINGRESESKIPEPDQDADIVEYSTRERRVNDASPTRHDLARGEREGKEKMDLTIHCHLAMTIACPMTRHPTKSSRLSMPTTTQPSRQAGRRSRN